MLQRTTVRTTVRERNVSLSNSSGDGANQPRSLFLVGPICQPPRSTPRARLALPLHLRTATLRLLRSSWSLWSSPPRSRSRWELVQRSTPGPVAEIKLRGRRSKGGRSVEGRETPGGRETETEREKGERLWRPR
jgi:hypothetical protein